MNTIEGKTEDRERFSTQMGSHTKRARNCCRNREHGVFQE